MDHFGCSIFGCVFQMGKVGFPFSNIISKLRDVNFNSHEPVQLSHLVRCVREVSERCKGSPTLFLRVRGEGSRVRTNSTRSAAI